MSREGKTELETLIERTRDAAAARPRPARGTQAAGLARVPRREQPRRLHRAGALRRRQRRLRPGVPRRRRSRSTCATPRSRTRSTRVVGHDRRPSTASPRRGRSPIVPDTPAKRREYEEEVVRTFYLSNADLKETIDLLRMVVDLRRIAPITRHQRDHRSRTRPSGCRRPAASSRPSTRRAPRWSSTSNCSRWTGRGCWSTASRSPRPAPAARGHQRRRSTSTATGLTLLDLRNLTAVRRLPDSGVPALYYRLLKSDTNTRMLANPQLRTSDGVAAQARFGDRVPVPTTDLPADRHRRRRAAADHVVQLREHRRQHRHHAAHPPRRRRVAGAEGRSEQHLGNRLRRTCRRSATGRSPR